MNCAEAFQIHYYLANDVHEMDALVRNKCEAELLGIFQEVCSTLGVNVSVDIGALREGGLREQWTAIGSRKEQIETALAIFTALMAIATLVSSRIPVSDPEKEARDKTMQELSIEEKQLAIQERKLAIDKLKKELEQGKPAKEVIEKAAKATEQNLKVQTRRSNFYKALSGYERVTAVGFVAVDTTQNPIETERVVLRSEFQRYVLTTNELPVETIDDAKIEIVAPVLKEGNYKWKGILDGEHISFSMTDAEFKNSVLRNEVSFQHGTRINCVLQISRKLDELGEVLITGYSVVTVLEKVDAGLAVETLQGKRHRAVKRQLLSQQDLF